MTAPPTAPEVLAAAVADNVAWCTSVARAHAIPASTVRGVWRTVRPAPPLFPSAVTTRPGIPAAEVVAALPAGAVGVKDAFADVDLAGAGFTELLRGGWVVVATTPPSPRGRWRVERVGTARQVADFAAGSAHAGLDWAALHGDPTVDLVVLHDVETSWRARAVVSSGSDAVGISNVELDDGPAGVDDALDDALADVWRAVGGFAARRFPGRPLVGWEPGPGLAAPAAAGFAVAGPLRVWVRG